MSELLCSLCMYLDDGPWSAAVTVIDGQAVCSEHVKYVADRTTGSRFKLAWDHARVEQVLAEYRDQQAQS